MSFEARPQRTATRSRDVSHFGLDTDMLWIVVAQAKARKQWTTL